MITKDEHGQTVVSDPVCAAVGIGESVHEAFEDWLSLAQDHYAELESDEESLHPRMFQQLLFLRKMFG